MFGQGLISMNFNVNTIPHKHWYFFILRVKTLKNRLWPNIEHNFDFRIFWFSHQVLKSLILWSCKTLIWIFRLSFFNTITVMFHTRIRRYTHKTIHIYITLRKMTIHTKCLDSLLLFMTTFFILNKQCCRRGLYYGILINQHVIPLSVYHK